MTRWVLRWFISAIGLILTAMIVPGIRVDGFGAALLAALIIGVLNAIVRPILIILTLPVTILTLGLFLLVVNGITLRLATWFVGGFHVAGWWAAIAGAIVLTIITTIGNRLVKD
ncbi:MAG: phage holin family protein [Symbiobacteriia bacterium]